MLLLQVQIHEMITGGRDDLSSAGVELRRALLDRKIDVVMAASLARPTVKREMERIRFQALRFDKALAAFQAARSVAARNALRASVLRPLDVMTAQVKHSFDGEERALYGALNRTLHQRATTQRMLAVVSVLAALLGLGLAIGIWRVVRRDFERAYRALASEVSERGALESQLAHDATHDPLTGLGNRSKLRAEIDATIAAGSQNALLYLDLDGFKEVNDTLGHDAGDATLCAVASRIAATVRPGDSVARLGGDEFAILLAGVATTQEAAVVAERLRVTLGAPYHVIGRNVTIGASIGVALMDREFSADDLLSNADLAMYAGKHGGKDIVRFFDRAMADEALSRGELDVDLDQAVVRGEFELHYQPIIGLANGTVAGLEALIRWRHPRRGLLAPGQFLPSAEGSGHMSAIGRWVLAQACADAASWVGDDRSPAPWVSVNVAASQLKDATLVGDVARALAATGLAPDRLVLEMSEWTSLAHHEGARGALREIADLGARIALDDFGTGYTALSSLRVGAIHILKLDKSLVDGIAENDEQACIVEAFVDLARTLGLETVAEGIEGGDQLEALRDLGCDFGQGFHLGRPMSPGKLYEFMAKRRGELAAVPS
jgi:diguanylate cyclase (GGDEF)-like protein